MHSKQEAKKKAAYIASSLGRLFKFLEGKGISLTDAEIQSVVGRHIRPLLKQTREEHDTPKDPNGRAYNRTTQLKQRKEMMQRWADYLENLEQQTRSGNVITANFPRSEYGDS